MKAHPNPISVAEYCEALNEKRITVNADYQRAGGIWSKAAQSFFIESIILGFPIPKLFLYQKLDPRTRRIHKEIVDGQQRSKALQQFFNNNLRLSANIETDYLKNKTFDEIGDSQDEFLTYSLPIDQFAGSTDGEVREAFRRINANNVPLNAEEQRNARYQGPFKWFIIDIGRLYQEPLLQLGLFSKAQLMRMGDYRLYTEVAQTIDAGFRTQKSTQLDAIYRKFNTSFPERDQYEENLRYGLNYLLECEEIRQKELLARSTAQTFILAAIAVHYGGAFYEEAKERHGKEWEKAVQTNAGLTDLAQALGDRDAFPELAPFFDACTGGTNVERARVTRFFYFVIAIRNR